MTYAFTLGLILGLLLAYAYSRTQLASRIVLPSDKLTSEQIILLYEVLRILVRQSARWTIASLQDESALISVLHANYGAGYLWAIQQIATTEQVQEATGHSFAQLNENVVSAQAAANEKAIAVCPAFAPAAGKDLAELAGE